MEQFISSRHNTSMSLTLFQLFEPTRPDLAKLRLLPAHYIDNNPL